MLQQTQVATVLERYPRFLERFPTLKRLALASQDEVLAEWSGMGYYSRARNLHRCAQIVWHEWQGQFPDHVDDLVRLPGIGRSTAAAIAVFSFGKKEAILDGNVKRVLSRLSGFEGDLSRSADTQILWSAAEQLLPETAQQLRSYTQGLMDFGATLCIPKAKCLSDAQRCPFTDDCKAWQENRVLDLPSKVKRVKVQDVTLEWYIPVSAQKVYLQKRDESGIWAGMWTFPEQLTQKSMPTIELEPLVHVLTHRRLYILRTVVQGARLKDDGVGRWFTYEEALEQAIPKPVKDTLNSLMKLAVTL
jgi:A/G-specific adenine glycosylase